MVNNRTEQLNRINDSYEDRIFSLAMKNISAEAEGKILYKENMQPVIELPPPEAKERFTRLLDKHLKNRRKNMRKGNLLHKALLIVAAAVAVFAVAMLTVSAFRAQVLNLFMTPEKDYTYVQITDSAPEPSVSSLPADWKNAYMPTYIPDGYEVTSVINQNVMKSISFAKNTSNIYYYEYNSLNGVALDTETAPLVKPVSVNGHDGSLVQKDGKLSITWEMDSHLFLIYGNISREELIKIAESVKYIT